MLDLIERKAQGEEIVVEAAPEEPKKVPGPDGRARGEHRRGQEPGRAQGEREVLRRRQAVEAANGVKPRGDGKSSNGAKKRSGSGSRRKTAKK